MKAYNYANIIFLKIVMMLLGMPISGKVYRF